MFKSIIQVVAVLVTLTGLSIEARSAASTEEPPAEKEQYQARTAENPLIDTDELALLVKPLTAEQLQKEADAWRDLLQQKTLETSLAELAIKQKNKAIEKAEDVQDALEDTRDILDDVKEASAAVGSDGDTEAARKAHQLAREASEVVSDTADTIDEALDVASQSAAGSELSPAASAVGTALDETSDQAEQATDEVSRAAGKTLAAAQSGEVEEAAKLAEKTQLVADGAKEALGETSEAVADAVPAKLEQVDDTALDESQRAVAELSDKAEEHKKEILSSVNELKAERTALVDRLSVVVDELSLKLGSSLDGKEHELVLPYRLYASAVSDIDIDVSDTQALYSNIKGWLLSDVGGLRLARNMGKFLAAIFGFWLLGAIVGKIVDKALKMTRITVELMRAVIVRTLRRAIVLVGIIVGLSAMDINVGPILAVVGAAGFVVAFALQSTLSNFASGIMIMIYRPYDVGDMINVGGVTGQARSMNLVTTTIATPDNQLLVVPNNAVWGNIITNITGSETRRVDLVFRISYEDDIETALRILQTITSEHPLVLAEPETLIAVQELGEYSVNFVCRPWSKTADYWQVYRDITRDVKECFQREGITTPSIPLQYSAERLEQVAGPSVLGSA